jgi:hypothetical protein
MINNQSIAQYIHEMNEWFLVDTKTIYCVHCNLTLIAKVDDILTRMDGKGSFEFIHARCHQEAQRNASLARDKTFGFSNTNTQSVKQWWNGVYASIPNADTTILKIDVHPYQDQAYASFSISYKRSTPFFPLVQSRQLLSKMIIFELDISKQDPNITDEHITVVHDMGRIGKRFKMNHSMRDRAMMDVDAVCCIVPNDCSVSDIITDSATMDYYMIVVIAPVAGQVAHAVDEYHTIGFDKQKYSMCDVMSNAKPPDTANIWWERTSCSYISMLISELKAEYDSKGWRMQINNETTFPFVENVDSSQSGSHKTSHVNAQLITSHNHNRYIAVCPTDTFSGFKLFNVNNDMSTSNVNNKRIPLFVTPNASRHINTLYGLSATNSNPIVTFQF